MCLPYSSIDWTLSPRSVFSDAAAGREALAGRLSDAGLKPSRNRVLVLAELSRERNDATAQELHQRLTARGSGIGLAIVRAVAPQPVNVLVGSDFTTVAELAALGVRRISVGGALARAAWGGFLDAAKEIAERGTFTGLKRAIAPARR